MQRCPKYGGWCFRLGRDARHSRAESLPRRFAPCCGRSPLPDPGRSIRLGAPQPALRQWLQSAGVTPKIRQGPRFLREHFRSAECCRASRRTRDRRPLRRRRSRWCRAKGRRFARSRQNSSRIRFAGQRPRGAPQGTSQAPRSDWSSSARFSLSAACGAQRAVRQPQRE